MKDIQNYLTSNFFTNVPEYKNNYIRRVFEYYKFINLYSNLESSTCFLKQQQNVHCITFIIEVEKVFEVKLGYSKICVYKKAALARWKGRNGLLNIKYIAVIIVLVRKTRV